MPVIRLNDDPGLYRIELTNDREIQVNVLALGHEIRKMSPNGSEPNDEQVVAAVRAVAKPDEIVLSLADHDLYAIGLTVLKHAQQLGNVLAPSQT